MQLAWLSIFLRRQRQYILLRDKLRPNYTATPNILHSHHVRTSNPTLLRMVLSAVTELQDRTATDMTFTPILSVYMVAMAVYAMCKCCSTVFAFNSKPHSQSFLIIPVNFNRTVCYSFVNFQLPHIVIPTRKTSWVKNTCFFMYWDTK